MGTTIFKVFPHIMFLLFTGHRPWHNMSTIYYHLLNENNCMTWACNIRHWCLKRTPERKLKQVYDAINQLMDHIHPNKPERCLCIELYYIALMKHMQSQIVFPCHTEYYTPVIVTRPTLAYKFCEYLGNNQIAFKKFYGYNIMSIGRL